MSTRSLIIDQTTDTGIYCHFDGYPDDQFPILTNFYNDQDKVNELLALGHLSSLSETIQETVAYHRDRGEDLNYFKNGYRLRKSIAKKICAEFIYVWNGSNWTWATWTCEQL